MNLTNKVELDIKIDGKKVKSIIMPEFEQSPIYTDDAVSYVSGTISGINYNIRLSGMKKEE